MDETNEVIVRKQIGRVFRSDTFCDRCPCGKNVCKGAVGTSKNELIRNYFLGICSCGNIFMSFVV